MDVSNLGDPIKKLVEVISSGIGTLYKPRAIRTEADAEAYKIETLAKAEAKKTIIEGEAKIEILERAKKRFLYQEILRQENIESIADKSIVYLEESNVNDVEVDQDWNNRFFEYAKDISNKEVQEVWAKILAKEVESPGRTSIKTLEILRSLGRKQAEIFSHLANCAINENIILYTVKSGELLQKALKVSIYDINELQDYGLLGSNDPYNLYLESKEEFELKLIDSTIQIQNRTTKKIFVKYYSFTKFGTELCSFVERNKNEEYIKYLYTIGEEKELVVKVTPYNK